MANEELEKVEEELAILNNKVERLTDVLEQHLGKISEHLYNMEFVIRNRSS